MPTSGTKSRLQPLGTLTRPFQIRLCEADCEYLALRASEKGLTMTDFVRYLLRKERDGEVAIAKSSIEVVRESDAEKMFNDPEFYNGLGEKRYTMEEIEKLRKENQ
jgi:hypothetical protein